MRLSNIDIQKVITVEISSLFLPRNVYFTLFSIDNGYSPYITFDRNLQHVYHYVESACEDLLRMAGQYNGVYETYIDNKHVKSPQIERVKLDEVKERIKLVYKKPA